MMRNLLFVLIALAFSSISDHAVAEPDPNFHIYICFGQSNMEGFPGIVEQDKGPVDRRFRVLAAVDFPDQGWKQGQWRPATPPLCRPSSGLCPADYFGRTLIDNLPEEVKAGIINVSVGGCKIELFGKESRREYISTAPGWMAGPIEAYGGNPYQRLVDLARLAQKDGVIKGILLHQGESNTNDVEWPNKVKSVYDHLLEDLGLNAGETPLLAGEVVNADQNGACASMNAIIDKLPKTIHNSHIISSKGCPCLEDHLHFTPEGYRMLGKRYAEQMLALLKTNEVTQRTEPTQ